MSSLTFDGCNAWLDDINYFLNETNPSSSKPSPAWRMVYVSSAYFLIAVDFILREHVTAKQEQRRALLDGGFRYGSAGQAFTEKVGRLAASLVGSVVFQPGLAKTVENELSEQASSVKAELLAEFFSKNFSRSALIDTAKALEASAFSLNTELPSTMSTGVQAVLGVLADFFGLDRKRILI